MTSLSLLTPDLSVSEVHDGIVIEPRTPLPEPAPTILHWLDRWAAERPDQIFLAERGVGGEWRKVSYAEAAQAVPRIARRLAERSAGPARPVLILSDNSVSHALVALAAFHVGAPAVPVSPAYSLVSSSFRRLKHVVSLIDPAVIYAEDPESFGKALEAVGAAPKRVLSAGDVDAASSLEPLPREDIGPQTIAKVLFTSGSTGEPRGVINTHRMLTANQESLFACWPFLANEPPVVVDWLPWSHTFGGNHNFNLVLKNGGSLYVDRGRPAPGLVEVTLENLADVGPTLWFNVPRGFDQAVSELERKPERAQAAFRNLRVIFYAAAALGASTRSRLEAVARAAGGPEPFFTSAWGSTETSPLSTSAHFPTRTTGVLGVPVPGVALKLARVEDRFEIRVKGPNVTPGYWQKGGSIRPIDLDADGFLPTGDAGRLVDEAHPEQGVAFAGRLSENFKLSSGTWVNVGNLRLSVVEACAPLVLDAVIAGHDREYLGVLLFPSPAVARDLPKDELRLRIYRALEKHGQTHSSSSEHVRRAVILERPLSLDDGETTDKGYTNQRRVLEQRASDVERLFAADLDPDVLVIDSD